MTALIFPLSLAAVWVALPALPALGDEPKKGLDPQFLLLPAFDVERSLPQGSDRVFVGDDLELKVVGIRVPGISDPSRELKLQAPRGLGDEEPADADPSEGLEDEGWTVSMPAPVASSAPAVTTSAPSEELRFSAHPVKAGQLTLPCLALVDSSGKAVARTNPFRVDVVSAIKPNDPKPKEPVEIKPPVGLNFPWWIIVALGFLAVLLIGGGIFAYTKLRKKTAPEPVVPQGSPLPEDEVALAALAELERLGLHRKGNFKGHYFRVSEVLKNYLGARYRFDAPESTGREIVRFLEGVEIGKPTVVRELGVLFESLDLVKFTDHVPDVIQAGEVLESAKKIVLMTRKLPSLATAEVPRAP